MDAFGIVSILLWAITIGIVISGVFWWIPLYIPNYAQDNTTEWVLSITTILAVGLNVARDLYIGDRSVRVFSVLVMSIVVIGITLYFVQGYIPSKVEKQQQTRQQQIALIAMNILLTVMDIGSAFARDAYPYTPPILVAGRRRK